MQKHCIKSQRSRNNKNENNIKLGESRKITDNSQYPKMWGENDKNWTYEENNVGDKESLIWENEGNSKGALYGTTQGNGTIEFKQSYYAHRLFNKMSEFKNEKYYDLMFEKRDGSPFSGSYFISCRTVRIDESSVALGIDGVNAYGTDRTFLGRDLYYIGIDEEFNIAQCSLRPVVSINLDESGFSLSEKGMENGIKIFELKSNI